MKRWAWLAVVLLYGTAAAVDAGVRVREAVQAGAALGPAVVAVSICAGLLWPIDLVARPLLATPKG